MLVIILSISQRLQFHWNWIEIVGNLKDSEKVINPESNDAQTRARRTFKLIVPGTTIGVMLLPSYVEVRDKGIVKKKIRIHGKSFDYVLGELELYFRTARKILRPGLLEEVLIKIGLPKADIILPSGQTPPQKEEKEIEEKKPEAMEKAEEKEIANSVETEEEITPPIPRVAEEKTSIEVEASINGAKPKVVAEVSETPVAEEKKPSIRISITDVEDVVASSKTFVTTPKDVEIGEITEEKIGETESEVELEETQIEKENETLEMETSSQTMSEEKQIIGEAEATQPEEQSPQVKSDLDTKAQVITEVEETSIAESAVIRPIIEAKALILGEDVVGRATLLSTAGFEPVPSKDDIDQRPYHFKRIIKLKEHRVALDVWSFDEAVKVGIQRKEFYDSPKVALIVYSVVDRWSFESIAYWLKEIALTNEVLPPVVIVGNKKDLRSEQTEDSGDEPISEEEGFNYAEELATTLAQDGTLHPVAFIETSCLTQENVLDAFTIAADLFIKSQDHS